jgi:hypothetical protein
MRSQRSPFFVTDTSSRYFSSRSANALSGIPPRLPAIIDFVVSAAQANASALVSNDPEARSPLGLIWARHFPPDFLIEAMRVGSRMGPKWGFSVARNLGNVGENLGKEGNKKPRKAKLCAVLG